MVPGGITMSSYPIIQPMSITGSTMTHLGPLHKTFTGEKNLVKSDNSGKHEFTIDSTIGRKLRLK